MPGVKSAEMSMTKKGDIFHNSENPEDSKLPG